MKLLCFALLFLAVALLTFLLEARRQEDFARNDALFFATAFPVSPDRVVDASVRPKNANAGEFLQEGINP